MPSDIVKVSVRHIRGDIWLSRQTIKKMLNNDVDTLCESIQVEKNYIEYINHFIHRLDQMYLEDLIP